MARYIDADRFVKNLEDDIKGFGEPNITTQPIAYGSVLGIESVLNLAKEFPTADVVPTSEVAKEFTCFVGDPHKVERCPYLEEVEKAKSEVAREIFEEIEKIINEPFAVGFNLLAPLKQALNDYNNGIRKDLLYFIAELKKKYTEEKE